MVGIGTSPWPWHAGVVLLLIFEAVIGHFLVLGVLAGIWICALVAGGWTGRGGLLARRSRDDDAAE